MFRAVRSKGKAPAKEPPPSPPPVSDTLPPGPGGSMMFPAASEEQTRAAAQHGSRMREWMFMTYQQRNQTPGAPQESRLSLKDLAIWGWERELVDVTGRIGLYAIVLNGLQGVFYGINAQSNPEKTTVELNENTVVWSRWSQTMKYEVNGRVQEATKGAYFSIYSTKAGVIIVEYAISPKRSALARSRAGACQPLLDELLPAVQHFSDVTFLEWCKLSKLSPDSPNSRLTTPSWILVRGLPASGLVSYCVKTYANREHIPAWPGITSPVGTYYFNVSMGLEIGKAIAMMLITHRERCAIKKSETFSLAVDSITVFLMPGDDDSHFERPSLLYHIGRFDPAQPSSLRMHMIQEAYCQAGLESAGSGAGRPFPYPIKPYKKGEFPGQRKNYGSDEQAQSSKKASKKMKKKGKKQESPHPGLALEDEEDDFVDRTDIAGQIPPHSEPRRMFQSESSRRAHFGSPAIEESENGEQSARSSMADLILSEERYDPTIRPADPTNPKYGEPGWR